MRRTRCGGAAANWAVVTRPLSMLVPTNAPVARPTIEATSTTSVGPRHQSASVIRRPESPVGPTVGGDRPGDQPGVHRPAGVGGGVDGEAELEDLGGFGRRHGGRGAGQ